MIRLAVAITGLLLFAAPNYGCGTLRTAAASDGVKQSIEVLEVASAEVNRLLDKGCAIGGIITRADVQWCLTARRVARTLDSAIALYKAAVAAGKADKAAEALKEGLSALGPVLDIISTWSQRTTGG